MNSNAIFGAGVAVTAAACLGVILYVAPHLRKLLIELCGTAERANFWLAFSNLMLFLVPIIFALWVTPERSENQAAMIEMADQLRWAMVGLVISVLSMGIVLSAYIPRRPLQP
jgi:uncharacterized membrane protein YhaH (DUF805 family)